MVEQTGKWERGAVVAGLVSSLLFHVLLGVMLVGAAGADRAGGGEGAASGPDMPRRRGAFGPQSSGARRGIEGPYARLRPFAESPYGRRELLPVQGRREPAEEQVRPYRFLELSRGRRSVATARGRGERSIDFGQAEEQFLKAMVIPKLGLKKEEANTLPRLTKYEQPERLEDGINIHRDNPHGEPLAYKAHRKRKAQYDRKRKKRPTLGELIDAPDDDDPRARPSRLEEIVGVADGSVDGHGTEGDVGNIYLGKVESAIRRAFNVPVFMTREELRKHTVDVVIERIDAQGNIVGYRLRRKSGSQAFDSAAVEAIKRFVPGEGGTRRLPEPTPDMLNRINRRGILVRLEGKRLR